jgi:hypothetical protein
MIPEWVFIILRRLAEIISLITGIQTAIADLATAQEASLILSQTEEMLLKINDSTFGLQAIQAQLATFQATTSTDFTAVISDINALPQVGNPYPYGPIDTGDITVGLLDTIASYVWAFPDPTTANAFGDELSNCWALAQNSDGMAVSIANKNNAPWVLVGGDDPRNIYSGDDFLPILDYSTIIAADTSAVVWLNRVFGAGTVFDGGSGVPAFNTSSGHFAWIPWLDAGVFASLKAVALGLTGPATAPVWPGLAGVTLGTSVPLATGVTVTGPLQGVIVAITAVPGFKGAFLYDTDISYKAIGGLTFKSDNGQDEIVQGLGFTSALYLPRSMTSASACLIQTAPGVAGTVTPFTIP